MKFKDNGLNILECFKFEAVLIFQNFAKNQELNAFLEHLSTCACQLFQHIPHSSLDLNLSLQDFFGKQLTWNSAFLRQISIS